MPAANPPFGAVTIDVPPELVDSFICRSPGPRPDQPTCLTVLEELTDVFAILEVLSARLAQLEAHQPGGPDQAWPERSSDLI
jgi:hypothetical protein